MVPSARKPPPRPRSTPEERVAKMLEETPGQSLVLRPAPVIGRAMAELSHLRERRDRILRRKRRLLDARRTLVHELPPRWNFARERRSWKHGLGAIEFRNETALIDQFALMDRFLSPNGDVLTEAVRVDSEPNRDERLWSYVLRGEAVLVRRFIQPQERFVRHVLQKQRAVLDTTNTWLSRRRVHAPLSGWTLTVLTFLPLLLFRLLVKLQGLLFLNVVKGQKALADTSVNLPLNVKTGFLATKEELRTEESRRKFRLSFLNERLWTPERRSALLFVLVIAAALIYVLSEILFQVFLPQAVASKRVGDLVIMYAMATRLFLPTPFEPVLIAGAKTLGVPLAVMCAAIGATVGSYLLFLIGSQVNQGLHAIAKKRPRLGRILHWLEDRGRKHAYWMLGVLLAIPLSPDSLAILGTLIRLRLGGFLLTIFISTVVRSVIFLTIIQGV